MTSATAIQQNAATQSNVVGNMALLAQQRQVAQPIVFVDAVQMMDFHKAHGAALPTLAAIALPHQIAELVGVTHVGRVVAPAAFSVVEMQRIGGLMSPDGERLAAAITLSLDASTADIVPIAIKGGTAPIAKPSHAFGAKQLSHARVALIAREGYRTLYVLASSWLAWTIRTLAHVGKSSFVYIVAERGCLNVR